MHEKFSLLKQLKEEQINPSTLVPKGIKYQEYNLEVSGKNVLVYIPLRECEEFETSVSSYKTIDLYDLRVLMRKYRGLRVKG